MCEAGHRAYQAVRDIPAHAPVIGVDFRGNDGLPPPGLAGVKCPACALPLLRIFGSGVTPVRIDRSERAEG